VLGYDGMAVRLSKAMERHDSARRGMGGGGSAVSESLGRVLNRASLADGTSAHEHQPIQR